MKIFLANPTCRIKIDQEKEKYFVRAGSRWPFSTVKKIFEKPEYLPFPFFLAYTAALLKKSGYEVVVDDGVAINETKNELLEKISLEKPDTLLFETSTPTFDYDLKLVDKIKQKLPKTIICLAGAHATTFASEILKKSKNVDFVFLGEYELNFTNLIESLLKKKDIKNISGIGYRKDGKILVNPSKLIDPLDELPFPQRDLFPTNDNPNPTLYWDGFCQYQPSVQMHASRGCPFRCNFCLWNQVIYQNGKYRFFSAKRVVDEMKEVVQKYKVKEIYFDDDTFTANKSQVLEICQEIIKRKLKVYWSVMGDAMITDEEMIIKMAKAGCIGIKFGVESGNKEILKNINKPIDFEKIKLFTQWCSKNKIKTHATFTFGLTGETKQTMQQTLDFAKNLDVDSVQFSLTTPFPGTRYYEDLKKNKKLTAKEWKNYDGSSSSVVRLDNISRSYLVDFCQKASGRWLFFKLKDFSWLKRQYFYFLRQGKSSGCLFVLNKIKRGAYLMFEIFK